MLWAMPNSVWGAGNVRKSAPAAALKFLKGGQAMEANKKNWYDYFWIWAILYFALGFCNNLCGRGQLFSLLGGKLGWSHGKPTPTFLISPWFRYGFLIFFLIMFGNVLLQTYLVFAGARSLKQAVSLAWAVHLPWDWAYTAGQVPDWAAQFSFGLYGIMLFSLLLGVLAMVLYKPRSWCVFCPMGTMTQGICKLKNKAEK